jgi:acyl carrier protein
MRTETELFSAVQDSICTVLDIDNGEVKAESKIVADLGAESIDFLDISCELEKAIDFELDFKDIFNAHKAGGRAGTNDITVAEIVQYLQTKEV